MTTPLTTTTLGSVARIKTGARDNQDKLAHGAYPFFVRSDTVERIDSYSHEGEAILVPGEGRIGEIFHYINGKFDVHQRVYKISDFTSTVSARYVYYYMTLFFGEHAMQNTVKATVDSLRMPTFTSFELRLPPLRAEQDRVVEALGDVDELIATLERLIAKKQAIKQGMMQQLLTGLTRLPGFTTEWRDARLGSLGMFLKGRGIKRDDVRSTGVACIRYGEIYTAFGDYTDEARSFVTPDVASTALPIRRGDVLFAGSGETKAEIGMSLAYTGKRDAVAGGDIIVLRGTGFDPVFLASLLNSPAVSVQKARKGQGDAVVHISSHALADVELKLPGFEEQGAIATVIKDADAEISALAGRLAKTRAIKQGMMQQLLTGRTRLPAEDTV